MNVEGEVSLAASYTGADHPSAQEWIDSLTGAYAQQASTEFEAQPFNIALRGSGSRNLLLDRKRPS